MEVVILSLLSPTCIYAEVSQSASLETVVKNNTSIIKKRCRQGPIRKNFLKIYVNLFPSCFPSNIWELIKEWESEPIPSATIF